VAPFRATILNFETGAPEDTERRVRTALSRTYGQGRRCLVRRHRPARRRQVCRRDLIGIPWQILVGPKGLAEGKLELKRRGDGSRENFGVPAEVLARLTS